MKIASYNIWNDRRGWPQRLEQIYQEIKSQNADLICLQDVPSKDHCKLLAEKAGYDFYCYFKPTDTCELAVLSKLPFIKERNFSDAIIVHVQVESYIVEVINVHLPWDSVLGCERQVIALVNENKKTEADYSLFCGDFNCTEGSSVHNFLMGRQSLYGEEAVPYWEDTAITYQNLTGIKPKATLDLCTNPRWKDHGYHECAGNRIDWILLKNAYPKASPKLRSYGIFGTEISPDTGYCASDHYGVYAEFDFQNM